jgi:uncharacterized protein (DUF4415 family)
MASCHDDLAIPTSAAEAAFKKVTATGAAPETKSPSLPGVKETVSLRIDREILDHFQADGPGWQDRIVNALREIVERSK